MGSLFFQKQVLYDLIGFSISQDRIIKNYNDYLLAPEKVRWKANPVADQGGGWLAVAGSSCSHPRCDTLGAAWFRMYIYVLCTFTFYLL
ncbi:hypothetical protein ABEX47_26115 [Paenibacillus ehimensis]|uniref:hypothetical protein n=1 Tax=Paenibacillus ehimensis TaxID=79264 RepID=UPI003D2D3849